MSFKALKQDIRFTTIFLQKTNIFFLKNVYNLLQYEATKKKNNKKKHICRR